MHSTWLAVVTAAAAAAALFRRGTSVRELLDQMFTTPHHITSSHTVSFHYLDLLRCCKSVT